ncbi:hypothetical protein [Xenorhabdus hominickii]|uniref:Uncharacterized protein n=1 Tax=Xenorhabdus hominickii TaxID=351679 RepID=A0A1V0M433_XENHO|nr:hypothetical protein [Xenorhabdus hominickii]ARD69626.1 hypothetical protein [Xenorhabdus hominickii]PHM52340.1 hypothetical protein Xhom_04417 [Xenorhabdus hominickii]
MASPILKFFEYSHLPTYLQAVSKPIGDLAMQMDKLLSKCAEKSAGLRKLLEAKDALLEQDKKARYEKKNRCLKVHTL